MNGKNPESKYMKHLPSVFHEVLREEEKSFIERYLRIFETVLTEDKDDRLKENKSLGEMLDVIGELFYPRFSFLFIYLFCWNDIPEEDEEKLKLTEVIKKRYCIQWAENATVEKIDHGNTIKLSSGINFILLKLDNVKNMISLEIDDSRTDEFIVRKENDKLNIYLYPKTIFPDIIEDEQKMIFNRYFSTEIDDFLIWMASWMALVLKEDWNIEKKREVIAKMIPIYKIRGTKKGLEEYLKIYVGEGIKITEYLEPFQVDVTSTIGVNTLVGDGRPNYFEIYMNLPPDPDLFQRNKRAIIDVIDSEKPAHTNYTLMIQVPTIQVDVQSTIGVDTLLGGLSIEERQ